MFLLLSMRFGLPEFLRRLLATLALIGVTQFSGGAPRGVLGATVLAILLALAVVLVPVETVAVSLAVSAFLALALLSPWPIPSAIPPPLRLAGVLLLLGVALAFLLSGLLRRRPQG